MACICQWIISELPHLSLVIVCGCMCAAVAWGLVEAKTRWPTKPNTLIAWSFAEEVCQPLATLTLSSHLAACVTFWGTELAPPHWAKGASEYNPTPHSTHGPRCLTPNLPLRLHLWLGTLPPASLSSQPSSLSSIAFPRLLPGQHSLCLELPWSEHGSLGIKAAQGLDPCHWHEWRHWFCPPREPGLTLTLCALCSETWQSLGHDYCHSLLAKDEYTWEDLMHI